jgi:hypothetical protein
VYESTMRRLDRRAEPSPMTIEASGPPGAERKPDAAANLNAKQDAVAGTESPAAAPKAEGEQPKPAAAARATPPVETPAERLIVPPAVTGGRGAAPDGVTFYSGLTVAGALLAFGFFTFMRLGRNEGSE